MQRAHETLIDLERKQGRRRPSLRRALNQLCRLRGGGEQLRFSPSDVAGMRQFYKKHGLVCVTNGLGAGTRRLVQKQTRRIKPSHDVREKTRQTTVLCNGHPISKAVYSDLRLRRIFRALHGYKLRAGALPLEYRKYPSKSSGMAWHKDLLLTRPRQVEMVYTVHNNNRNTRLVWKMRGRKMELKPCAGDVVFVQPNRTEHKVTPMGGGGTRSILKFIAYPWGAHKLKRFAREKKDAVQ